MSKTKVIFIVFIVFLYSSYAYSGVFLSDMADQLSPAIGTDISLSPDTGGDIARIHKSPLEAFRLLQKASLSQSFEEDPEIKAAKKELLLFYLDHLKENISDSSAAVKWNHFASNIVLTTVHILLLLGVIFSSLEFKKSYALFSVKSSDSEIEISANKIAVKTSLHGILLLSLSFAFYSLFVIYVYPIQSVT